MSDDFIAVYRSPGPHWGPPRKTYDIKGVAAEDLGAAIADGWHVSFLAALGLEPEAEAVAPEPALAPTPVPPDNAPPTRAEMEQQAALLGIKVDRRWSDETLMAKITAAMQPAPSANEPI
jgi:hypothetical protein